MPKRMRHKYFAQKTEVDGIKFHSKLESEYYRKLLLLQERGEVIFFLRQVPLYLPGGVRYVVDFIEFWAPKFGDKAGEIRFVDVKGIETQEFKTKKRIVESIYPIEIEVVKNV